MRSLFHRRHCRRPPPASRGGRSRLGLPAAAAAALWLAAALALAGCGRRHQPNLLVVTLDTTRADHLGCYGFSLARTPAIDRLAAEGVRCSDAITAAPITLPSHATIMTGLYPPAHGVRDNGTYALGADAVTLAERLHRAGYRTQAIVSALVLNRRYNLGQGFDGYDDDLWSEDRPRLFLIRSRPGPKTAARAVRWLAEWSRERPRRPFFLWIHLFDAHQPYTAPVAERVLSPSVYDAEIAVLDQAVARVLDELRRQGALDDTLVVLTADHGESLGEHGEKTHALFIYDATVRVPLVLRYPRRLPRGEVYAGPVRTVDIVPTVLAALGLPGGGETQGRDLLPALRGEVPPPDLPQYCESLLSQVGFGMSPLYGVRHAGWKWIRAPRPEVYDLHGDPHELANLYPREARRGSSLDRELAAILDDSRRRALAPQKSVMDGETARSLRALGYLAPAAERAAMNGLDPKDGLPLYAKLEQARHLEQRKQWAEAERVLREVVAEVPKNVSALGILAVALLRQGDLAGAREQYLRILAIDPKQSRVYVMLAAISMLEGDLDGAERDYRQALAITPGFVEAMSNLGMIAALRDDDAEAERWYRRAMAADPSFPLAYRRLADLHYERGDFAGALELYRKALAERADDFAAAVQAGNSARRTGKPAMAAEYFTRAAHDRPASWVPIYNLACLKAVSGDPQGALALLASMRGFRRPAVLENDRDLAAVRSLPGYDAVLQRIKAQIRAEKLAARRAQRAQPPPADDPEVD
ncbi:MAG TPA: sulfatase-like hydrolase/transferase [Thermoanaerobaculia bacterium]|nr:sulfatase-like hydrolase/transferase [Thermoanaerobaculia bacterium]